MDQKGQMSFDDAVEHRELAPGVILYKEYKKADFNSKDVVGMFIWKVEITSMNILDFEVNLENSENIELEGVQGNELKTVNKILPFETKVVARVILQNNWKLKSKFKLTMNVPDRELQYKYIDEDVMYLQEAINHSKRVINYLPIEIMSRDDIERELDRTGMKFIDLDFLPNDEAMVSSSSGENIRDIFDYVVHWRRPEDIFGEDESELKEIKVFYYNEPGPNDIQQGLLTDNHLASALSAISEKYNLVKRLFKYDSFSRSGVYQVKLCIKGEWMTLTIDDLFPCVPRSNPLVSRSPNTDLWVLILEKAMAKVYESYYALTNVHLSDFLLMLTGCPTYHISIEDIYRNEGAESCLRKIKQFVVDKKYIAVAISKISEEVVDPDQSDIDDGMLTLPNYGYTILDVKNKYKESFLILRKIWYDQKKEEKCQLYEKTIRDNNPVFEGELYDGVLLMAFDDFIREFPTMTVCYTKNWEEVRIRGKFVSVTEPESKLECVLSKWYYNVVLDKPSTIVISLHQDEDKVRDFNSRKQMMDISLTVLKQDNNVYEITHVETLDFSITPNLQLELNLNAGNYIILPRTTGCFFGRPFDKVTTTKIELFNRKSKTLNPILVSTIRDIFKKFDMLLNRELKYSEFKGFWECITGTSISMDEFKKNILDRYTSSKDGITEKGFINFFEANLQTSDGDKIIWNWLENLGYDNELYPLRSRCFMLTFHSDNQVAVSVRDAMNTDLNFKANKILLRTFGEEKVHKTGNSEIVTIEHHSKNNSVISVGAFNKSQIPCRVTLDFTGTKSLILSTKVPKIEKIINPNQYEFFLHFYCIADEYGTKIDKDNLGYNIIINPINR